MPLPPWPLRLPRRLYQLSLKTIILLHDGSTHCFPRSKPRRPPTSSAAGCRYLEVIPHCCFFSDLSPAGHRHRPPSAATAPTSFSTFAALHSSDPSPTDRRYPGIVPHRCFPRIRAPLATDVIPCRPPLPQCCPAPLPSSDPSPTGRHYPDIVSRLFLPRIRALLAIDVVPRWPPLPQDPRHFW